METKVKGKIGKEKGKDLKTVFPSDNKEEVIEGIKYREMSQEVR
jgi:hypothetical protein